MTPANLQVLRTEHSENHIPGLKQGKDHMSHKSPLSVVDDVKPKARGQYRSRQKSWGEAISSKLPGMALTPTDEKSAFGGSKTPKGTSPVTAWSAVLPRVVSEKFSDARRGSTGTEESSSDEDDDTKTVRAFDYRQEADKSLRERVKTPKEERYFDLRPESLEDIAPPVDAEAKKKKRRKAPIGTRMTMTSRVGYFQDRIISPTMVRSRLCF